LETGAIGCGSDGIPVLGGSIGIGASTAVGDGNGFTVMEEVVVGESVD